MAASCHNYNYNNLIWRAMTKASISLVKEFRGLTRSDGLTLIPWSEGHSAT